MSLVLFAVQTFVERGRVMGINVSIVAGKDEASSTVNASGSIEHVITKQERKTFGVEDKQLKAAVKADFGKTPTDAYLKSPTPWGDLYKKYKIPEVETNLVVQSANIRSMTSEPVIVKTQDFANTSSVPATFTVSIHESVTDTTSSSWNTGGELTVDQKVSYGIKVLGGETSMQYSETWGKGGEQSKSVTVGSSSGVTVELQPGEAVVAELSASRGVLHVRIFYEAYLNGKTAVNYNPTYKGHHFYAFYISEVMDSGGIENSVVSTEDIEISYYSYAKIELKDKRTGALKASFRMSDMALDESPAPQ